MGEKETIYLQKPHSVVCDDFVEETLVEVVRGQELEELVAGLPLPFEDYKPIVGVTYDLSSYNPHNFDDFCLMLNPYEMGTRKSMLSEGRPIVSYILTPRGVFERAVFSHTPMPETLRGMYERIGGKLVITADKAHVPQLHFMHINLVKAVLAYIRQGVSDVPNACSNCSTGSCGL